MKNKLHAAAVLSLAIYLSHSAAKPALACTCVEGFVVGAARKADAIFSGEVVGIKYLDDPEGKNPEPRVVVKFKVIRSWKHVTTREFAVHTVMNAWSCNGFNFREGQKYLVYARRNTASDVDEPPKVAAMIVAATSAAAMPSRLNFIVSSPCASISWVHTC